MTQLYHCDDCGRVWFIDEPKPKHCVHLKHESATVSTHADAMPAVASRLLADVGRFHAPRETWASKITIDRVAAWLREAVHADRDARRRAASDTLAEWAREHLDP